MEGDRSGFTLPEAQPPAVPIDPAVQPKGVELPSFITGNADFYRSTPPCGYHKSPVPIGACACTGWSNGRLLTASRIWNASSPSKRQ